MYKAVLLVCALALTIQSIAGACIGAGLGAGPFGFAGPLGLAEPYGLGSLGAPYGAYGAYGLGYGIGNCAGPFRSGLGFGAYI
ncbi:chorion class A protein L11-like isoform X2 [Vanessa tameamea]|uniref:Chorion class A protein L11-like isoform X2 n=1 Tax=Vanessa tameamea TaxID=334116 RepID=A0A8B8I0I3_VANTA|nr:chorion class A protein L11-like [Vanessa tameamea]XP_026490593.1 chorion class A protein L11-like [Vanessa tameamea]